MDVSMHGLALRAHAVVLRGQRCFGPTTSAPHLLGRCARLVASLRRNIARACLEQALPAVVVHASSVQQNRFAHMLAPWVGTHARQVSVLAFSR